MASLTSRELELANERGNFPADPLKRDPLDFVLWQAKKDGEPSWPSPWGDGRPGWHIECSAMSMKYLGESFAIHGGGGDLVFPHHEAEIAQSECLTGKPFVRFWMHTGMLYCGEHKMSKSLGNMIFLADLLPVCPPDAIRLYLLSHHYREPWNHDRRELAAARTLARKLSQSLNGGGENAERRGDRTPGRPIPCCLGGRSRHSAGNRRATKLARERRPGVAPRRTDAGRARARADVRVRNAVAAGLQPWPITRSAASRNRSR